MKRVKCKSGLTGSQEKLQDRYTDFKEFKAWSSTYGVHKRLGYTSMKACWESNPTIQSSTDPSDLAVVHFHAVKKKDGTFRVKESTSRLCKDVKGSSASFMTKQFALDWIGTKQ